MPRYAEIVDVEALAITRGAIASIADDDKNKCLDAASSEADVAIASKHRSPLTSWPPAVTLHVAKMAAFHMMGMKGYKPGDHDALIRLGYEDGLRFFERVAAGKYVLTTSETAPPALGRPTAASFDDRGFGRDGSQGI